MEPYAEWKAKADAQMWESVAQDYKDQRDKLRRDLDWWRYVAYAGWLLWIVGTLTGVTT
jgi:predicted branched-subunit amino acid permease